MPVEYSIIAKVPRRQELPVDHERRIICVDIYEAEEKLKVLRLAGYKARIESRIVEDTWNIYDIADKENL